MKLIGCLLCGFAGESSAQYTKYGVTVEVVKTAALSTVRTYEYLPGQSAADKTVDKQIINALERELTARGITKVVSERPDALVTYFSLLRTDVDLKSKPNETTGSLRQYSVGMLVVSLLEPAGRQKLFSARTQVPLDPGPEALEATINAAVAAIFEKYPVKGKKIN